MMSDMNMKVDDNMILLKSRYQQMERNKRRREAKEKDYGSSLNSIR